MSPVITAVEIQKKGVVSVTIDGADAPTLLPLDTAVLHHLKEGAHLPADQWRDLVAEGRGLLAVRKALEVLARGQKTEQELRTSLGRTFEPEAVEQAIQRMSSLGYLNDAMWAKGYVASGRSAERGRALLRHELGQRGVEDRVAAGALAEHDDRAAADVALRKRLRSLRHVEEPKRTRRLYDFLRRRGFSDSVARDAIAQVLREELDAIEADEAPVID